MAKKTMTAKKAATARKAAMAKKTTMAKNAAMARKTTVAKKAAVAKKTAVAKTTKQHTKGQTKAAARPKGLQSVSPGFTVNDATASVKWYCDVLGFSLKERWEENGAFLGGTVVHGQVGINLGQDDWKLGRDRKKGQGVRMFITTGDDIDAYAQAIKAQGGALDHEPKDEWGYRAFSVTDPDGYKITFMRPLAK